MDKATAFRKKYNDAGVLIEIVKFDGIFAFTDDALDYAFELAKALGARAISTEIAEDGPKRLGAVRRQAQDDGRLPRPRGDGPGELGEAVRLRDAQRREPRHRPLRRGQPRLAVPFLKQHHDRITHVHVKDRKANKGQHAVRPGRHADRRSASPASATTSGTSRPRSSSSTRFPAGSDRMTEIKKSVEFCRTALAS